MKSGKTQKKAAVISPDKQISEITELLHTDELPFEAALAVARILSASGDDVLAAAAKKISETHMFSLSHETTGDITGLIFGTLPKNDLHIERRRQIPISEYSRISPESVAKWFSSHGEFSNLIAGYEPRRQQLEMAAAVAAAFNSQCHLAVEAGTGTGKTMAYLVPAVLWSIHNNVPVVISTNTKNLQEQIFHKDLPLIRSVMGTPFKTAIIKGRANYVCLKRAAQLICTPEDRLAHSQFLALAILCAWIFTTGDGDAANLPVPHDPRCPPIPHDLFCSLSEECRGRKCPYHSRCFLQKARARSLNADIIITNHSVVFSEPDAAPAVLPRHSQIIFDEAHNLEEAATNKFKTDFTQYDVKRTLARLHNRTRGGRETGLPAAILAEINSGKLPMDNKSAELLRTRIRRIIKLSEKTKKQSAGFLDSLAPLIPSGESSIRLDKSITDTSVWKNSIESGLFALQDSLFALTEETGSIAALICGSAKRNLEAEDTIESSDECLDRLYQTRNLSDTPDEARTVAEEVSELYQNLMFLTAFEKEDYVYWLSIRRLHEGKNIGELHSAPIHIGKFLAEKAYATKETVVFCSATLRVDGNIGFIANRIGIDQIPPDRLIQLCEGSPFDYSGQCLTGAPMFLPDVPSKNDDGKFSTAFSDFTAKVAKMCRGRTLVLFTSYSLMLECAAKTEPILQNMGISLLVQGGGESREKITERFKCGGPSVLFGTDSFWEGVDIIGDALICVIIVKLPFDAVNDPLLSARADEVKKRTGESFRGFTLPNAVIKFRQGFGRLIRHKNDRGLVIVTDKRIFSKNYGFTFRNSVPAKIMQFQDEKEFFKTAGAFLQIKKKHGKQIESQYAE